MRQAAQAVASHPRMNSSRMSTLHMPPPDNDDNEDEIDSESTPQVAAQDSHFEKGS